MGDGSSGGGLGGILFEAGKIVGQQGQKIANSVVGQTTGNTKPLFGGPKSNTTGSFTPKPQGGAGGQVPKLDPFGDFGKMFEGGKMGGLGAAQPPVGQSQKYSQADLDTMAAENSAKDQQEIAKKQAELAQLAKQLHDENYYNAIRDAGKDSIAKERKAKQQEEEQEEAQKQQLAQQQQGQDMLPGSPLAKNQQLGDPVAVQQAKTQTEANRGTSG